MATLEARKSAVEAGFPGHEVVQGEGFAWSATLPGVYTLVDIELRESASGELTIDHTFSEYEYL